MARFWAALAVTLGKRVGLVSLLGLVVTVVLGLGLTRLDFATGQDSYLNDDEQVYLDNVAYQELFGGQAMLSLFTVEEGATVVDLFTEDNIDQFRLVTETLGAEGVSAVVSPVTALEFTQSLVTSETGNPAESVAGEILLDARERDPDPESAQLRLEDSLLTLDRLAAAGEQSFTNPDWVRFLLFDNTGFTRGEDGRVVPPPQDELSIRKSLRPFFPDRTHAQMVVRLDGNQSIEEEGAASDLIVDTMDEHEWDNAGVVTTGAPVLLKDINDYLQGGMLTLGAIAVGVMALVLLLLFRVRWRLLPLAVVLIGVVWAFGLFGYTGIPLSLVTISGLPILIGVGVDFSIQMHSRVEEEVVIDAELHPIQRTMINLVPPLIIAAIAAVVAFIALQWSRVPMIRDFGILLMLGVATICIAGVLLPASFLGMREFRSPTHLADYRSGPIGRLVVALGSLPRSAAPVLAVLAVLLFAGGAVVEDDFDLQTDPEEWVDQDSQVIADLDAIRSEVGSTSELGIYVQSEELFGDETVRFVHDFATEQLDEYPDTLLTASSIVTTVSFLLEIPGTTELAPTGENVAAAHEVAPTAIKKVTANEEAGALNLIFRTGPSSLEQRAVVVNEIRDSVSPPAGVSATPSGLAVVGVGLLENLEANRALLTYLSLGFVAAWLAVRFLDPLKALYALIPVLIAVGASSLVISSFGFELSPLTTISGPLVIAACSEFSVLILTRYVEERESGAEAAAATTTASARTGRAFVASALTTVGGFLVLAFSPLPLLRDFGLIVSLNVAVALLSALVLLPPILVWVDERGWLRPGRRDTSTT